MIRDAILSKGEKYRYALERKWDHDKKTLMWVMLNPSTADALTDDATIRRCVGFAERWGYGAITVGNLYAYRATFPRDLWARAAAGKEIVGKANDHWLQRMAIAADTIVVAWGSHAPRPRAAEVFTKIVGMGPDKVYCLGKTVTEQPVHPVRQPYDIELQEWSPSWLGS